MHDKQNPEQSREDQADPAVSETAGHQKRRVPAARSDLENPPDPATPDPQTREMIEAVNQIMPFGKFKGTLLLDLPEPYVVWFKQRGFPQGRLGQQLALIYEIKLNGMEKVFRPLVGSIEKPKK